MIVLAWVVVSCQVSVVFRSFIVLAVFNVLIGMFTPAEAIIAEHIMPGIRNMDLANDKDLVVGTSFITDMISMSNEVYAIKPYTPNSIILISLIYGFKGVL